MAKTTQYCSRVCYLSAVTDNRRKLLKPSKEKLKELLWEKPTSHIAKDYGVSDNAVAKWAKGYGLSKPPRGYWQK